VDNASVLFCCQVSQYQFKNAVDNASVLFCCQVSQHQFQNAVNNARRYLESQLTSVRDDPYALSIITYALLLAGSAKATSAVTMLNDLAIIKGNIHYLLSHFLIHHIALHSSWA